MVLYTEISELFWTSFRLALVSKILLKTRLSSSAFNGPNDSSSAVFKDVKSANFLSASEHEINQSKAFPPK